MIGLLYNLVLKAIVRIKKDSSIVLLQDMSVSRQLVASLDTAKYIDQNMSNVLAVKKPMQVLDVAMSKITIKDGLFLEFGVFSGITINHIASNNPNSTIYGFDSFEGLPDFWRDGFSAGKFKVDKLPIVKSNVKLIKGWFNETLPKFILDRNISLLHIDCDLYSSTKTIFKCLQHKIVPGTVIVFDEYFNYPGWQNDEFKAFKEFIQASSLSYEYIAYCSKREQVAVQIKL